MKYLIIMLTILSSTVNASITNVPVSISTTALVKISDLSDIQMIGTMTNYTNACVYTNAGGGTNGNFNIKATTAAGSFTMVGTVNPANTLPYTVIYYSDKDLTGTATNLTYDNNSTVNTNNNTEPDCSTIGDNASIKITATGAPLGGELYKSILTLTLTAIP